MLTGPPSAECQRANEFGSLFWQELDARGAAGVVAYLEDVEAQRENAVAAIQKVYREAAEFNQGAGSKQETFRHGLVVVKCASTIVVAGITLPVVAAWAGSVAVGSLAGFAVGTTYSVTLQLIKHWDQAESSELILVARDKAATKTGQKLVKEGAKGMRKIYEGESQGLKKAEETLAGNHWLEKRIAAATDAAEKSRLVRRLGRAKLSAQAVKNAGRLATALKAVPNLFFAWSAGSAMSDAYHEW